MTTTEIAIPPTADLANMSTDDLHRELSRQIEITAQHVARLAAIWRELERRGEDLSRLRSGLAQYLPAVASGRLVPEAIVRLAGNRTALRALALLAPDEQRDLIARGTVQVKRGDEIAEVPLQALSPAEIARVFDPVSGTVRQPADQTVPKSRIRAARDRRVVLLLTYEQHRRLHDRSARERMSINAMLLAMLKDGGYID